MNWLNIIMIYHSNLGASISWMGLDLAISIDDCLLLARLNDQRRPFAWRKFPRRWWWCFWWCPGISDTVVYREVDRTGLGEIYKGGNKKTILLPWRTGALIPVQHDSDAPLVVHDFPGGRLIVQLQGVDGLADDLGNCWDCYWGKKISKRSIESNFEKYLQIHKILMVLQNVELGNLIEQWMLISWGIQLRLSSL